MKKVKSEDPNEEEVTNDGVIPAELKAKLTEKVSLVLGNIGKIEKAVNNAVDTVVMESETPMTVVEINAALINVMKKMNQREIMQLIK